MGNIKWIFSICFISILICFGGIDISAEESEIDTSMFKYKKNDDGTITITKYIGTDETVSIPSVIDSEKVTIIGEKAFYENNSLKYLTIPEGIEIIEIYAFNSCENLEYVQFPEGLKIIDSIAFSGCYNLRNVDFPDTLESIGLSSFSSCIMLEKIELPNNIKSFGGSAFEYCHNLTEVNFRYGLEEIDLHMFSNCVNLKKIIIPDSVKIIKGYIGEYTGNKNAVICANCNSYARAYANKYRIKFSCLKYHDWDDGIITIEPTLINEGQKTLTCTACKTTKVQKIPKLSLVQKGKNIIDPKTENTFKVTHSAIKGGTVEFIDSDRTKIIISIPDSITINGAVYKVTSVSKNAFKNNKKIKKITVGKNIKSIGSNAFSGCKNLRTIIVKSKQIKTVGKNAFKGIHSKAEIKVPKKKLKSYRKMFSKKGLKDSVKIIK